jgi:hypothetical protein
MGRESEFFLVAPEDGWASRNPGFGEQEMESDDLVSAPISNEDKEGSVVRLDAILDERGDPRVELLLLHSDHVPYGLADGWIDD